MTYADALAAKARAAARKAKRTEKSTALWGPKVKRKKLPSISKLKKKLWDAVSLYIRDRDQYIYGKCRICLTNPIEVAYHLIPSNAGAATRHSFYNIVGACSLCNFLERHNRAQYAFKHIQIFGIERMTELDKQSRMIVQIKRHDLNERLEEVARLHAYLETRKAQAVGALGQCPDPGIPMP